MIVLFVLRSAGWPSASSLAQVPLSRPDERCSTAGPAPQPLRRTKGMRRGSPTQRQGRTRPSPLPPHRRGGRHLAGVAQDRVPLGQGRQAPVSEDAGWPPALPGGGDPPARRRAPGAADGLAWSGSSDGCRGPTSPLADAGELCSVDSGRSIRRSLRLLQLPLLFLEDPSAPLLVPLASRAVHAGRQGDRVERRPAGHSGRGRHGAWRG
jgi:hypothetical protein